mgnify:CR=1 FL=1
MQLENRELLERLDRLVRPVTLEQQDPREPLVKLETLELRVPREQLVRLVTLVTLEPQDRREIREIAVQPELRDDQE